MPHETRLINGVRRLVHVPRLEWSFAAQMSVDPRSVMPPALSFFRLLIQTGSLMLPSRQAAE